MEKKLILIMLVSIVLNNSVVMGSAGTFFYEPQLPNVGDQSNELIAIADLPGRIIGSFIAGEVPLYPEYKQTNKNGAMDDGRQASKYGILSAPQKMSVKNTITELKAFESIFSNSLYTFKNALKAQAPPGPVFFASVFLLIYLISLRKGNIPGDSAIFLPIRKT
jgi:hypothetical protein